MNGILRNVERRLYLRRDGVDVEVIETYDLLIGDLREERRRSILYDNYFSTQFQNVIGTDNAVSTSDDNANTDSQNNNSTL